MKSPTPTEETMERFSSLLNEGDTVLDIGAGGKMYTKMLQKRNFKVLTNGLRADHYDFGGFYHEYDFPQKFNGLWARMILEHQLNVNLFLQKMHHDLLEGGALAIIVPPAKNEIVGGHVTLWNAGILLYNLVLAGFNCKDAMVRTNGYEISVVTKKISWTGEELSKNIVYDNGDIKTLSKFFPEIDGETVEHGFDGAIGGLNWDEAL
jgi:hypothetical protein